MAASMAGGMLIGLGSSPDRGARPVSGAFSLLLERSPKEGGFVAPSLHCSVIFFGVPQTDLGLSQADSVFSSPILLLKTPNCVSGVWAYHLRRIGESHVFPRTPCLGLTRFNSWVGASQLFRRCTAEVFRAARAAVCSHEALDNLLELGSFSEF